MRAKIETDACQGELYLHGAHVTGWRPAGTEPVLWMSDQAVFEPGQAIRGGVPICFPWFGAKADDPDAPSHGPARITPWDLTDTDVNGDRVMLMLSTRIGVWALEYVVNFGPELTLELMVVNAGDTAAVCEAALHTYFTVADVRRVVVTGLESAEHLDSLAGRARRSATGQPITFTGETDRLYVGTTADCVIHDPVMQRTLTNRKLGSSSTVVWNPWVGKAARMPDFGDDEWPGMLCIETANAGPDALTLEPGEEHVMSALVTVGPLG